MTDAAQEVILAYLTTAADPDVDGRDRALPR